MSRGTRKSGANAARRPKPPVPCRGELARVKVARAEEHVEHNALLVRHAGEIPIGELFGLRAMRLKAVITG